MILKLSLRSREVFFDIQISRIFYVLMGVKSVEDGGVRFHKYLIHNDE